jgi:hypothetical protein
MTENKPTLAVRLSNKVRVKVAQLLEPNSKLSAGDRQKLFEDFNKQEQEVDDEDFGMDDHLNEIESKVLHYESLRIVARHSLFSMKDILNECEIVSDTPPPPTEASSLELERRRDFLKVRAKQREYNQMMFKSDTDPSKDEANKQNIGAILEHSSVAVQVIVATLASFGVAFYAGRQSGASQEKCLVWGLLAAMIILIVEGVLFIVRANRVASMIESSSSKKKHNSNVNSNKDGINNHEQSNNLQKNMLQKKTD